MSKMMMAMTRMTMILSNILIIQPPSTKTFAAAFHLASATSASSSSSPFPSSHIAKTETTVLSSKSSSSLSQSSNDDEGESGNNKFPSPLLQTLTSHSNSFAAAYGLQVESKLASSPSSSYQCAPISLLPNAYPRTQFETAQALAPCFNLLVEKISRDEIFLTRTLDGVKDADPFTAKLLRMYLDLYGADAKVDGVNFAPMADRLGILRSDYMLHLKENEGDGGARTTYELKQVELNTIASSFAGLAVRVAGLHRQITERFAREVEDWLVTNKRTVLGDQSASLQPNDGVPENPALNRLPHAMNVAHRRYLDRFGNTSDEFTNKPVVLFVVQEGETNTVDQRMLEFCLWEDHGIAVVRMSLAQLSACAEIDEETGALYILSDDNDNDETKKEEVSLVYFRAGYAPTDYPDGYDGIEWQARETLERSRATKCPCLGYHLAGTKKVQQELARPGLLERFFPGTDDNDDDEKSMVNGMRKAFAGLYSLGEDAMEEDYSAVNDAISGSEGKYVLKPQREGGGYNYYGERLAAKISENVEWHSDSVTDTDSGVATTKDKSFRLKKELAEFILMERLFPPRQSAVLLRSGIIEGFGESISELGCFGTIVVGHDGEPLHNEYSGFLLRTKFSNVDEGGVASGFATLSSPFLC